MKRIDAPMPIVWVIGRTKTVDYAAVNAIQLASRSCHIQWGKGSGPDPR
jgi:hypothetical protein